jgi:hypothetical protein
MFQTLYLGNPFGTKLYIHWSFWFLAIFVFHPHIFSPSPQRTSEEYNIAPRQATPQIATPRHATPRHATPRHATSKKTTTTTPCGGNIVLFINKL